jgi:DNA invertase Pin-like site-specific DNA recombinase
MLIGYARTSPDEPVLDLQLAALRAHGCEKIYTDTARGTDSERPRLGEALASVKTGDTLVVLRLDRLGRSIKDLFEHISMLQAKSIGFKSLTENIDTTTDYGKLVFEILDAVAEFERRLIRERAQAGLLTARARGRSGGRPKALTNSSIGIAKMLYADGKHSIDEICGLLKISRATLFRYVK